MKARRSLNTASSASKRHVANAAGEHLLGLGAAAVAYITEVVHRRSRTPVVVVGSCESLPRAHVREARRHTRRRGSSTMRDSTPCVVRFRYVREHDLGLLEATDALPFSDECITDLDNARAHFMKNVAYDKAGPTKKPKAKAKPKPKKKR